MRILFINAMGEGFAKRIDVTDGTTVGELFQQKVGGDPKGYTIKLNHQEAAEDDPLRDGDRVSVSPAKVVGA